MLLERGPWAIRREDLEREHAAADQLLEAARLGAFERPPLPAATRERFVAIVPVRGVLQRGRNLYQLVTGATAYDVLAAEIRALAADESVAAIVLDVDSPGGDAVGLAEVADAIYKARAAKPTSAVVRGHDASAAYVIASAAERVVVARDAIVGSVGVVLSIVDVRKAAEREGIEIVEIVSSQSPNKNPDPTTDEGRAQLQARVDAIAEVLVQTVARNRRVSPQRVLSDFGQGDVFIGDEAVKAGLADALGTLDEHLAELLETPEPDPEPDDPDELTWDTVAAFAERHVAQVAQRAALAQGSCPAGLQEQNTAARAREYVADLESAGLPVSAALRLVRGRKPRAYEDLPTLDEHLARHQVELDGHLARLRGTEPESPPASWPDEEPGEVRRALLGRAAAAVATAHERK